MITRASALEEWYWSDPEFMNILSAIFPVFFLLILGSALKALKITNDVFLKTADRLVYFIFFPAMLFWKISSAPPGMENALNLCLAGIIAVAAVYLVSLCVIVFLPVPRTKAGSFSQACYRFNTYIGMAIVMNALGEEGVRYFGILIGFAIPLINVMAVSTLIWFSGRKDGLLNTVKRLLKALLANPLIIACTAGLIWSRLGTDFPVFIEQTFSLMTAVTMPLALISVGGALTITGFKANGALAVTATVLKLVLLPFIGITVLNLFCVTGTPFSAGLIFFTLPTSTSIYVLSAQLDSDLQLASSAIFISTVLSFFSLSTALFFIGS